MNLSELIAKYGDQNVTFQKLDDAAISLSMSHGLTQITFVSDEPFGNSKTDRLCLIVWMDRPRVAAIIAEAKANPTPETSLVGIDQPQNHDNLQSETRSDPSSGDPEYGGADPRALKHDTSQAFPLPTSSPWMVGHKTPEYTAAQAGFADYFLRNYPSDTVIFDPSWHAPKLFYAAFRTLAAVAQTGWRPIAEADRSIVAVQTLPDVSITLRTSYPVWVRDEDGRVYEAVWSEGTANYWWDLEGESPVDPVEFMPHPLAALTATTEGRADV